MTINESICSILGQHPFSPDNPGGIPQPAAIPSRARPRISACTSCVRVEVAQDHVIAILPNGVIRRIAYSLLTSGTPVPLLKNTKGGSDAFVHIRIDRAGWRAPGWLQRRRQRRSGDRQQPGTWLAGGESAEPGAGSAAGWQLPAVAGSGSVRARAGGGPARHYPGDRCAEMRDLDLLHEIRHGRWRRRGDRRHRRHHGAIRRRSGVQRPAPGVAVCAWHRHRQKFQYGAAGQKSGSLAAGRAVRCARLHRGGAELRRLCDFAIAATPRT